MADGLDFEALEKAQGPQQAKPEPQGLDFDALSNSSQTTSPLQVASPAAGLNFDALVPNPNLDTPDKMTPAIYARNVWRSLASGVEPVSRSFVNEVKGAGRAIGSAVAGVGNVFEDFIPGTFPFMPYSRETFSEMKSMGTKLANFSELKKDPNGSWLTEDLPYGIGGAAPYMAAGGLGGAAAATGFGMADMGQTMYQDAKDHGASEDDANLSFLAGSAIGASEALPVGYFLKQINRLSGGSFYELAKNLNGAGAVREAVKGFLLSGATEAGQQVAQNWVAKDMVGYDPTRTLSENAWDNFITGGAVGSLLMGSVGALHTSTKIQAREELKRQFDAAMATEDPINKISGQFTPTGEVAGLREEEQAVTGELRQAGKEFTESKPRKVSTDFVSFDQQEPHALGTAPELYDSIFGPASVDNRVERLIVKPDENHLSVQDALERTPVVTMEINPYREQISMMEQLLKEPEPPDGWGLTHELIREKLTALKRKTELSKIYASHIKDYVAKFLDVLGDGTKAVIGDFSGRESFYSQIGMVPPRNGGAVNGLISTFKDSRMRSDGTREPVFVIEMDFDKLATARWQEEQAKRPWYSLDETKAQRQSIFETVNHELGHYLVTKRLNEIQEAGAKSGSKDNENTQIYAAVYADYNRWLTKMKKSQFYEYLENVGTPQYQPGADAAYNYTSDIGKNTRDYLFSFDEYFAQQTARLATQGKLAGEKILTKFFKPVLAQYQELFEKLPHFAKNEYGNFEKFVKRFSLQHQISEEIQKTVAGGPKTFYDALKGLPGFNPENFAGLEDHLDQWNQVMEYGENLLQIQRANPHIEGLRSYVDFTRAWAAYSRSIDARATETLSEWRRLGKKKQQAVSDVLFEETENEARLDAAALQKRLPDLDQQKVYAQIRADFDFVLDEMRQVSIEHVKKNFPDNELMQQNEIAQVEAEFKKMKAEGYFPYMRFGKWTLSVRDNEGKLVSYETFDTKRERDIATTHAKRTNPKDFRISPSVMTETQFVVQGLPAAMLRTMKDRIPNLSPEQSAEIDQALQDMAPFKGLKKHFLKRKGTEGYSLDAMRSYANYMRMSAGHLSRVKYGDEFVASIAKVDGDAKTLSLLGKDATKRQQIANWMKGHHDYIMNPASEWTALRGAVFQWFLGFNIKSAAVNLSQVPMITFPYLAARYGDINAARELASANAIAVSYWKNRPKWTEADANSSRGRIVRLLEQGKKDGWLDQSLAMELAVASSEGNIQKTVTSGVKRGWYKMSEWGAKPFAVAEKFNRTIAAISTYNLEYARTKDHTTAYNAARDAVDRTQYENSRWNRPRFQRGKLGTAFVFTNYVQNTLHFMLGGDKGASRSVLMLFLAAGLMGLPGAENAEDLIDFLGTKGKELLGSKNPKFDLRLELRQALQELGTNPDLVLHGAGRYSFGLGALGEMTGLPLPEFDLSGSLSMGRPLPLTSMLGGNTPGSSAEAIGKVATEAGGAGMAAFDSWLQAIWSRDPDQWKRAEKAMPVWMKNVSQGSRLLARGKETSAAGDVIAEFDPNDPKDLIEALGKTLGFTPTDLSVGWEKTIAQKEAVNYYRMRMEGILKTHNWATLQRDETGMEAARQRIKEFNEQVPFPEMKISADTISASYRAYVEARKKAELGIENQKRYIRLRQSVEGAYNPPASKDTSSTPPPSPL